MTNKAPPLRGAFLGVHFPAIKKEREGYMKLRWIMVSAAITAAMAGPVAAQSVAEFYKGSQVTMLIGSGAGGARSTSSSVTALAAATTPIRACWPAIWDTTSPAIPPSCPRTCRAAHRSRRRTIPTMSRPRTARCLLPCSTPCRLPRSSARRAPNSTSINSPGSAASANIRISAPPGMPAKQKLSPMRRRARPSCRPPAPPAMPPCSPRSSTRRSAPNSRSSSATRPPARGWR